MYEIIVPKSVIKEIKSLGKPVAQRDRLSLCVF
jgi:mRNA-degrading endonuclease RelE of RelBE toxin-antitoxin system